MHLQALRGQYRDGAVGILVCFCCSAAMLRNVPVKIGQSLPAGPANISHFFPPRLGPLIATGLRHGGCGFVVLCDSGKIGIEQLLTVIACHSGIIFIDARPLLSGKP
jgi:hypothetical protein